MHRLVPFTLSLVAVLRVAGTAQPLPASRAFEPVVVSGEAVAPLEGATPGRVAAFRYEGGGWVPVPVQVDEREEVDLAWVYNGRDDGRCSGGAWCYDHGPVYQTLYMDEGTFLGPDSNPFVDADDEVVFMAQDAGARAPADATAPPGVMGQDGVEVKVVTPGQAEAGYVYLFWHDGRYPGDAGRPYVAYTFSLLSGSYKRTYNVKGIPYTTSHPVGDALGANPEDSEVVTAFYRRHYADRWIEDEVEVRAGGATGVDLLDRWKIQFGPGNCVRTEYTGSAGRGAFIANRTGPVRAIRSVLGFNSGALMQQDSFFYERYYTAAFYYRGHPVHGGPMAYDDYSANASGMRLYSNLNPDGFLLDGDPDKPTEGDLEWEVLQGSQGTLVSAFDLVSDIPDLQRDSYYADEAPAEVTQCTGDTSLYGANGLRLHGPMPNTDPTHEGPVYTLEYDRHQLYAPPAFPLDSAQVFIAAVRDPLRVSAEPFPVHLGADPGPDPTPDPVPAGPVALAPPRPNPSSDIARVTYWIESDTNVRLSVYDLAGRRLAVLDEGHRAAGYHDVSLAPERFPAGTYLVRLDTPLGNRSVTLVRQ